MKPKFAWLPAGINFDGIQHYMQEELDSSKSRFRIVAQCVWIRNENGKIFYLDCVIHVDKIYASNEYFAAYPTKAFIRRVAKMAKTLKDDTWHHYTETIGKRRKVLIYLDGTEVNP